MSLGQFAQRPGVLQRRRIHLLATAGLLGGHAGRRCVAYHDLSPVRLCIQARIQPGQVCRIQARPGRTAIPKVRLVAPLRGQHVYGAIVQRGRKSRMACGQQLTGPFEPQVQGIRRRQVMVAESQVDAWVHHLQLRHCLRDEGGL